MDSVNRHEMVEYGPSSTALSSPVSLPHTSPPTTPELSDDGLDIERLPPPAHLFGQSEERKVPGTGFSTHLAPSFILVIGGLGYIGSHTVLELLREGQNGMLVHASL